MNLSAAARILVVDDEPGVRLVLLRQLERLGAVVTEAESAEAALRAAENIRFSCALLDISLPGMTGFVALPKLLALGVRRVYLMTGYDAASLRADAKLLGAEDVIEKPIEEDFLRGILPPPSPSKM